MPGRLALGLLFAGGLAALVFWRTRLSPAALLYANGKDLEALQMEPDARDAYIAATKREPSYAPPYRALAEMASRFGRNDASAEYWREFIARDPSARHAYCKLARAELQAGVEVPALSDAEAEFQHDSGCPLAHLVAGILYARQADPKRAISHLVAASQAFPNDLQVQLEYARVLSRYGDYPRADSILRAITTRDKSHAEPYYWLGYVCARRTDAPRAIQQAEQYLNLALDLQPDYPQANFELARLLFGEHEAARALPYAQRAVDQDKHYPAALYLLAQIEDALGRRQDAKKVRLAFGRESRLAAREKSLLKQLNLDRSSIETMLSLGRVEIERERPREALLFLRDAASSAPQDTRVAAALRQAEALQASPSFPHEPPARESAASAAQGASQ